MEHVIKNHTPTVSYTVVNRGTPNGQKYRIPTSAIGNTSKRSATWWLAPAGLLDNPAIYCRYYSTFSYGVGALIQAMNGRNGANITPSLLLYSRTGTGGRHRKLLKLVATSATRSTLD